MYFKHTHCRACGYPAATAPGIKSGHGESLLPVFNLGLQPLANDFCAAEDEHAGYAPLEVLYCPRCTLAQLSVVVRPEILYSRYLYVTSRSQTMELHFAALYEALKQQVGPFKSLLEIGSNDGTLLAYFSGQGVNVVGIDPANNLTNEARKHFLPTVTGLFNSDTATQSLAISPQRFDVVLARHVFCHIDNWRQFMRDLELVCHHNTLICIEVPYVIDLLQRCEFDTIYHEHLSYLSLRAMEALLKDSPFQLHHIEKFPVHGGAIAVMLSPKNGQRLPTERVCNYLKMEQTLSESHWREFAGKASAQVGALSDWVRGHKKGTRIAILGASAKATVWVNACLLGKRHIAFAADSTPQKQWRFIPGSDIPITDEGAILRELPDYVICGAWNFRDEILEKNALARSKGVKFVFPVPDLEVV